MKEMNEKKTKIYTERILSMLASVFDEAEEEDQQEVLEGAMCALLCLMKAMKEHMVVDEDRPKVDLMLMKWIVSTEPSYGDGLTRYLNMYAVRVALEVYGTRKEASDE